MPVVSYHVGFFSGLLTPFATLRSLLEAGGSTSKTLTERRPPSGTLNAQREPLIQDVRDRLPLLVHRRSGLDIEAPVFHIADHGPCYVPDRTGNDEYVKAADSDYEFG
ncbi:hypothetical protein ACOZ35_13920 [Halorubrum xinjiangense]|uniref:hypothetical protein n=1 Tax=Halorubrum xinjiangense TaxID=261291 RepID=UPI003C6F79F3